MATTAISFDNVTNATTASDGTGYFDVIMKTVLLHVKEEWNSGRIKGTDYANVYLGAMQSAMANATQFALQEQLKEQQRLDMVRKHNEDADRWTINEQILGNQKATSDIDLQYKPSMASADLGTKHEQIEAMIADTQFNTSKKTIMEQTRKDNIRMKSTEQYAEFLKYISAAGVVPGDHHFSNLVGLISGIIEGVSSPDNQPSMADTPTDASNVVCAPYRDPDTNACV